MQRSKNDVWVGLFVMLGFAAVLFLALKSANLLQINWSADLSRKGLRESGALMVNYLYDLSSVEENHERFTQGEIDYSRAVGRLMVP
jgi:hypothetical protein